MIKDPVTKKILQWEEEGHGSDFLEIYDKIDYLSKNLFIEYEPLQLKGPSFNVRLNNWLENLKDSNDQRLLLRLVPELFYLSPYDSLALYRDAYQINYLQWLIETLNVKFDDLEIIQKINSGIEKTWFCPMTDSFNISRFYHLNGIAGNNDNRPQWRPIQQSKDSSALKKYIHKEKKEYIVLLEDFVGSGIQTKATIEFAAKEFPELKILIIPLMICPDGETLANELAKTFKNIIISPVVTFKQSCFIQREDSANEISFFKNIKDLAFRTYEQVAQENAQDPSHQPGGPLGFGDTGALIVLHTNTPNNTLPLVHYHSSTWNPLFLRHIRYQK